MKSLRDISEEILETIGSAELLIEQITYHKIKFKGISSFARQQAEENVNKSLRIARNVERKGLLSTIPIARSLAADLDQLRKKPLTKDLIQLEESLENCQILAAQSRHETSIY